jgi:hypothetical protein
MLPSKFHDVLRMIAGRLNTMEPDENEAHPGFQASNPMKRNLVFCLLAALLLSTAHRLPAPIQEVPESPTPVPQQSAKPKLKGTIKPKAASESSESSTKQRNAFDGTWVGTENLGGSVGNIQSTQVISGSGAVVRSTSRLGTFIWSATCDGKTMQWSVKTKYGSGVRTFTPNHDGKTALMIFQSGDFHSSATFSKTSP